MLQQKIDDCLSKTKDKDEAKDPIQLDEIKIDVDQKQAKQTKLIKSLMPVKLNQKQLLKYEEHE